MTGEEKEYSPQQKAHLKATFYATKPTRTTTFIRTFLPWQIWRFISINLRMLILINRSHQTHLDSAAAGREVKRAKAA